MTYSFHSCFLERYYQRKFIQRFKKSVSLFECFQYMEWWLHVIDHWRRSIFAFWPAFDCVSTRERNGRWKFKSKTQPWNTSLLNDDIRQVHSWEFLSFSLLFFFSCIFTESCFQTAELHWSTHICLKDHFNHVVGFPAFSYEIMSLWNAVWSENLRWALCQCLFWMVLGVWEPALLNIGYFDKAILQQKSLISSVLPLPLVSKYPFNPQKSCKRYWLKFPP